MVQTIHKRRPSLSAFARSLWEKSSKIFEINFFYKTRCIITIINAKIVVKNLKICAFK